MKIKIDTKTLVGMLTAVQGIGNHPDIPLAVSLSRDSDHPLVRLAAFDGQVMTEAHEGDLSQATDTVVVPINVLATAARDIPGAWTELEIQSGSLHLQDTDGYFDATFNPMYYDGRQPWTEDRSYKYYIELDPGMLADALRKVVIGVSQESIELGLRVLHGVHLRAEKVDDGLRVTVEATDLYYFLRYTYIDTKGSFRSTEDGSLDIVIPAKAASEVAKAVQGGGLLTSARKELRAPLTISKDGDRLVFDVPADAFDFEWISVHADAIGGWQEIVGDNIESLIPKDLPSQLIVPVKDFTKAINVAIQSSPDNLKGGDGRINLTTKGGCLEVTGAGSRNRITLRVPGVTGGGEISTPVPVYGRRLQKLLRVLPDLNVRMRYAPLTPNEKPRPLLFTVVDKDALPENADFFAIMIPVRNKAIQQTPIEPFAGLEEFGPTMGSEMEADVIPF